MVSIMTMIAFAACSSAKEVQSTEDGLPLPPRPFEDGGGGGGSSSGSSGGNQDSGGVSESDGSRDAAVEAGPGCNGAIDCERVVFVTRGTFMAAAVGGITGGDAKCQAAADTSTVLRIKGRTFRAWLSDGSITPTMRFAHGTKPYILGNGVLVANDWNDLTDGTLRNNGINRDELGQGADNYAWTGVQTNGAAAALNCGGWALNSGGGMRGNVGGDENGWTESQNAACSMANHLYCFEE
jgi:hypothetical protein